jgi:hypothetical protein
MAALKLLAACGEVPGLRPLEMPAEAGTRTAFYKLPWLLARNSDACDSPEFEQRRQRFLRAVRAEGVALDEGFRGFARRTSQRCRVVGDLPHARQAAAGTVILHHPVLLESANTLERVADAIRKAAHATLA